MALNTPVQPGQTVVDIAMQALGSIESVFALALLNNMAVSDDVAVGQQLNTNMAAYSPQVAQVYADNGYLPASGQNVPGQTAPVQNAGIGYWYIQHDFIVN